MSEGSKFPQNFVHLHLHTEYSLLDGAIRAKDLLAKCKEFGMSAVAMTDHGNMYGAIDFYLQAKKAGIKPIIGCEIYFTTGSRFDKGGGELAETKLHHLVLLAKNKIGYENLCKLVTKAHLEGFYYKPRADLPLLREFSEGLIALSACLAGLPSYHFLKGSDQKALESAELLRSIYGDNFYLEIQENGIESQRKVNDKLIALARAHNFKLVATNDCHYLEKEDAAAQEVLLCIQTQKVLADEKRMRMGTDDLYFKPSALMWENFAHVPDAVENTLRIADECNLELKWTDEKGKMIYQLPKYVIPTAESEAEYFERVATEGLYERFEGPHFRHLIKDPKWESEIKFQYLERLETELELINAMGFAGYFLIVSDFIKWSKSNGIPVGPGRGSGAGSIVAYALSITNIDPIPFNLLFERFINPERISMPDFDVDFCQQGRSLVIDYVTKKYGDDRVCQIITFGKLKAKMVIRDVCRVYGLPYAEADIIAKLIPEELGITLSRAIEMEPKLKEMIASDPKIRQIFKIADRLEDLNRNAGVHAAGVIITEKPIENYCPLARASEGEKITQFDKNFAEKIGLVKFDFLGLKTLTVIDSASRFIKRDSDPTFDIEQIDLHDKEVYDFISKGETIGVFQLESSGMIDLCKRIMPGTLDDITAINALYRPGPLESGMVDDFIEIKHGRKKMAFPFPQLEQALKDTYGVIVYQEQVMNIARVVAGYSLGQADMLRRAMGKKDIKEMANHREIFLKGAAERNFDVERASDLYDLMANFAEYGFNKSHAVAYALIAYQTAFLKRYYPAPFFAGLLSTELSNADKVTIYINDAKHQGIGVLPPDVNESLWLFNVVEKNIRFGMGAVKNVGESAVADLIAEREESGPFTGLVDLCVRVPHRSLNRRMVESLIKVGAFDQAEKMGPYKMNRKMMLENLDLVMSYAQKKQHQKELGQGSLFDLSFETSSENEKLQVISCDDFSDKEKLDIEKQLLGIYVSGHPLMKYDQILKQIASMPICEIGNLVGRNKTVDPKSGRELQDKRDLVIGGMISASKVHITKKGTKMAFVTLEDLSGKIECVVFSEAFEKYSELLLQEEPLLMEGYVNLSEEKRSFFPQKIALLKDRATESVTQVRFELLQSELNPRILNQFKELLLTFRGDVPAHIIVKNGQFKARVSLGEDFLVNPTAQMASKIDELFRRPTVSLFAGKEAAPN